MGTDGPIGLTSDEALAVWEAVPDGLLLVDTDGVIVAANKAAHDLFGYEAPTLVGSGVDALVPEPSRGHHASLRHRYDEAPTHRSLGDADRLEGQRRDGSVFPLQISLTPWDGADRSLTLATTRDATPWVKAEGQLAVSLRRQLIAEDHERIARELHDTVIQELFAAGMSLTALSTEVDRPAAERLQGIVDNLDEVIGEIRTTIFGLRQPMPAESSLRTIVVDVVESVEPALGFSPTVTLDGELDPDADPDISQHVGPVVRELLTNVAKHANASQAEVSVTVDDRFTIRVTDDGHPPPQKGDPIATSSGGLANLARRAELCGGTFRLEVARSSGGTEATWEISRTR